MSSWSIEAAGALRLAWAERPAADADRLHPRERAWLARLDHRPERRIEWIAGRLGLAELLPAGAHVLAAADGGPAVHGARWTASIAHEDGWVAVAARPGGGRVGVDVVPDRASASAARALTRAGVDSDEPAAAWAALECAAKLRRVGVAVLLERPAIRLDRNAGGFRVEGLGRPARVRLRRLPGAVLALADEP